VEPARDLLARWRADRMAFRREAILLEDGRALGEVMEPWQADDFRALDDPAHRHAYLERPRGHSKTGDLGTEAVTELVLGRPGSQLFCAAADEEQARLLLEDVRGKFERSPTLKPLVRYTRTEIIVKATGSRLKVMSGDAPSAYGLRPDWIALDELAEWRRRDLWDSLWTATGKRASCRISRDAARVGRRPLRLGPPAARGRRHLRRRPGNADGRSAVSALAKPREETL
jgi:phage terminase large subunit-like protein